VVAGHRLAASGVAAALGIEGAAAVLPADIGVDEGRANAPAMVETQLRFAQALAGDIDPVAENEVVAAQVADAQIDRGFAQAVAVQHAFGAQGMGRTVAVGVEGEAVGLALGAVVALAVAVIEAPPTVGQAVVEALALGMTIVVADRIAAGAQVQLIGQPQGTIPVQTQAPLLLAGAALAIVVPRQADAPRLVALALEAYPAAADLLARHQLQLRPARRQAAQLLDQLLQFAQVEHLARLAGERHGQFALAGQCGAVQAFQPALDDDHFQLAIGQILLRQVGAGGDVASAEVVVGDGLEQRVELASAQALAFEGLEQGQTIGLAEQAGAFEADVADLETALLHARLEGNRLGFARKLLQLLETALLLLQQVLLALADQLAVARGLRRGGNNRGDAEAQPYGQRNTTQRHAFNPLNNENPARIKTYGVWPLAAQ
jgi:hypothetical protein